MNESTHSGLTTSYLHMSSDHGQIKGRGFVPGTEPKIYSFTEGTKEILFGGPLNLLLPCGIIGLTAYYSGWNDGVTFSFSLLAIAPLAERLGYCTEQLAIHTNDSIGGLLNATFGNATEVIVGITALSKGLYRVVQLSLLGSVLSNLLLVLGSAFFFGGLRHKTQSFGKISSQMSATILILGTMCLVFPSFLTFAQEENTSGELNFSRGVSVILLVTYVVFIYFQLISHRYLYDDDDEIKSTLLTETSNPINPLSSSESAHADEAIDSKLINTRENNGTQQKTEDEEEEDILGFFYACVWLCIITVIIAVLSDAISSSIQHAGTSLHISGVFLSTIVLPIIGNAAEHASAIIFGMRNKLDLSLGIAIGSSCQISVFVVPLMVIVGWIFNKDMSLNFGVYESLTMLLTVVCVTFAIKDGTSNYFIGIIMIVAYLIISAGFLAHYDEPLDNPT